MSEEDKDGAEPHVEVTHSTHKINGREVRGFFSTQQPRFSGANKRRQFFDSLPKFNREELFEIIEKFENSARLHAGEHLRRLGVESTLDGVEIKTELEEGWEVAGESTKPRTPCCISLYFAQLSRILPRDELVPVPRYSGRGQLRCRDARRQS